MTPPPKKVLLIDDDLLFIFLVKKTIAQTLIPVEIKEINNALDALNYLKDNATNKDVLPDVIFLDLKMPVMDGWEFIERYRDFADALIKKANLYIVTSSISPVDISKGKAMAEVTEFVVKPILKDLFAEILNNCPKTD